jgi:hypothetical protein
MLTQLLPLAGLPARLFLSVVFEADGSLGPIEGGGPAGEEVEDVASGVSWGWAL